MLAKNLKTLCIWKAWVLNGACLLGEFSSDPFYLSLPCIMQHF